MPELEQQIQCSRGRWMDFSWRCQSCRFLNESEQNVQWKWAVNVLVVLSECSRFWRRRRLGRVKDCREAKELWLQPELEEDVERSERLVSMLETETLSKDECLVSVTLPPCWP